MAGNSNIQAKVISATASVSTVDLAILTDPSFGVLVTNDTGTAPIWFTVSHPGGPCPVPTVGGLNCFCVASVAGASYPVRHDGQFGLVVQLISSGTPTYTVQATGPQLPV